LVRAGINNKSDVALSSDTPGGYVGQTSPLFGVGTSRASAESGLPDVASRRLRRRGEVWRRGESNPCP